MGIKNEIYELFFESYLAYFKTSFANFYDVPKIQ